MNEQIEKVLEMPAPHKWGILAGSILLIAAAWYFIFLSSTMEELSSVTQEIEGPNGLQFQISQQRGIASNLEQYLEEVKRLEIEFKKALTELPDKKEIGDLLAKVSTVGRDSGLEVRLFKPKEEEKRDYYAEVPVEMEMYGSYHQVATFFDEVGQLSRIVNLGEFHMKEPEITDESVYLKTTVVATTFRFLDESERPQVEEEGANRKRRGRGGEAGAKGKKKGAPAK